MALIELNIISADALGYSFNEKSTDGNFKDVQSAISFAFTLNLLEVFHTYVSSYRITVTEDGKEVYKTDINT